MDISETQPATALRRRLVILALAVALMPMSRGSHAEQARAHMKVSATVVDSVGVRSVYQAQTLQITAEDVRRGYVEVAAASRFDIRCTRMCLFEFTPTQGFVKTVRVTGLDAAAELDATGAALLHKPAAPSREVAIGYRFTLAPDAQPGVYPWPVAVSVMPM
jgi:hypothetical protein